MLELILIFFTMTAFASDDSTSTGSGADSAATSEEGTAVGGNLFQCREDSAGSSNSRKQSRNLKEEFYKNLLSKVKEQANENLNRGIELQNCFQASMPVTTDCYRLRNNIDQDRYPMPSGQESEIPKEHTLKQALVLARAHLALASRSAQTGDPFAINRSMRTHGFKSVRWDPLSPAELEAAQTNMGSYVMSEFERAGISVKHQRDVIDPNQLVSLHERGVDFRRVLLLRKNMTKLRKDHLDVYYFLVSKYPIMNYLRSANPSRSEIYEAARELVKNARKEVNAIKRINASSRRRSRLLDYKAQVNELVAEKPEYCGLVKREYERARPSIALNAGAMGALLATSIYAPPVGLVLGVVAGGYYAVSSIRDFQYQKRGVYSRPIDLSNTSKRGTPEEVNGALTSVAVDTGMLALGLPLLSHLSKIKGLAKY